MALQILEKVVAMQTLETVKEVLRHLQNWALQLEDKGDKKPRELTQLYGQVRRIRDYLNRSIGAHTQPVELDMDESDCNLLASCCIFELLRIATELKYSKELSPNDKSWLEDKRDNLSQLTLSLATQNQNIHLFRLRLILQEGL